MVVIIVTATNYLLKNCLRMTIEAVAKKIVTLSLSLSLIRVERSRRAREIGSKLVISTLCVG